MTVRHLDRLLRPTSIAVFGASSRPQSVGGTVWRNLRAGRFGGPIHPVNPKHSVVDGVPAFASAAQLPDAPDLAVICTPPATVPGIVAELGERGTRAAIVVTGGLDASQQQAVLNAARPHLLRLLGPDSLGLLSPHLGLNASFAHADALPGEIAVVSQSGTLATAILDWTRSRGIGLSHLISLGAQCDVDFGDLLDYLASDPATRAILLYMESVPSVRKFMSAARAAARNKPVIVVKAGREGDGLRAAALHTGAPTGDDRVYDAAIRRAGMLRADTLQELFLAAETLARFRANRSETLTILTNAGGAGVMAADAAARAGIALAEPGEALRARLAAALPPRGSAANPIDIAGDAPVARYTDTLAALLAERDAGAVLFIHAPAALVRSDDIAKACLPLLRGQTPRVLGCWLGDAAVAQARQLFAQAGVPDYATPEDAVRAFALLHTYRRNQASLMETPAASEWPVPDAAAARRLLDQAQAAGREWLDGADAQAVLRAYGIPTAATEVAAEPKRPRAQDLFVGARVDGTFGPVILCGPGGAMANVDAGSAVALPPLNRILARELLSRTGVAALLAGDSDGAPVCVSALHDALVAVSQMLADLPAVAELDIHPLRVDDQGVQALNARLRLAAPGAHGADRFAIRPYPAEWVRRLEWNGRPITVRPIRPEDEAQHRRFLESLDPEDLRLRFFQMRRELPHSELARFTQIDYDREMAFIAEAADEHGSPQTLGVARTVCDPDKVEAEYAIVVRSDLKGAGLGRLLFEHLIAHARSQGVERLMGVVLRENTRMLQLARALGFEEDASRPPDPATRCLVKVLGKPASPGRTD